MKNKTRKPKQRQIPRSPAPEDLEQVSSGIYWTLGIVRPVGYALLAFFFIDAADTLSPLNLMNPAWEFQTIGALVESAPVPLIALVMIFFGKNSRRGRIEMLVLKVLSVIVVLMGIVSLLFIPVVVVDAVRISRQSQTEVNAQVENQLARLDPVKTQLENANTEAELEALLSNIVVEGNFPGIEGQQQFDDVKNEITTELTRIESTLRNQAQANLKNQRRSLLKNSVKWNIGALISGILFLGIWQATDWTRRK